MTVVLLVIAAVIVFAIAAYAVGKVTHQLAAQPHESVLDLDDAVEWVADRLPDELTARLSYDDVRSILGWQLDYLETKGVASEQTPPVLEELDADDPVVVSDDEAVAFVLGRSTAAGLDLSDVDILFVLDAQMAYLREIGAVGRPSDEAS